MLNSDIKESKTDQFAKVIWDYCHLKNHLKKSDAIFCLCSLDTRVAERAAKLYLEGFGDYIIFSGALGKLTKDRFTKTEAEVFAEIAIEMGVPKERVLLEDQSTNTGENIQFTYKLLQEKGLSPKSLLLVQKPYMERRTYAMCKKQWPDTDTEILVTSPQLTYDEYFNDDNPKDLVLNIMVGDLQRTQEYPKLGYQIEQNIPDKVWAAYKEMVKLGYSKHLLY